MDDRDGGESSPQPGRRLRGDKVTVWKNTGRKEMGGKERGWKAMGGKAMRGKETGVKTKRGWRKSWVLASTRRD